MVILYAIAIIIGYIIISIITTMLFIYSDRKEGVSAQEVYNENDFEGYCVVGFLFPLSLPLLIIATIVKGIGKFTKIISVTIVETKIAIEKSEDKE